MEKTTIAMCLIIGLMLVGSVVVLYNEPKETTTSFCDSAPLEYGSDFPTTCYETPQSWIDEDKVYAGEKLEVKK